MNERIKAGADIHAGDGGYSLGTQEKYDEFVKVRNKSLDQARIKELYIQAIHTTKHDPADDINIQIAEKFAELIIQECARVARATPCPYTDELMSQQLGHTWDMASSAAGREIVQHFGVK